jgi:hypothetical protein
MAISTDNALVRFVKKARDVFARELEPEAEWAAMTPVLAELLSDRDVLEASQRWPLCTFADGRAENLLFYEDPDFGFVLNGLVVDAAGYGPTGVRARVHDHGDIYTLYGILDGHQIIERFDRVDDRSAPDRAELRPAGTSRCGPGEIDLVGPFEIHTEASVGERAVALIVRSKRNDDIVAGRYEPDTNRYFTSLGPRQTRLEMFA